LSVPIVALIDTDANPEVIDYPIPGNDDSIKSVKYITSSLVKAIKEGLNETKQEDKEAPRADTKSTDDTPEDDTDKEE
ncbi:MAG: 30S ribosomal protein S2, partial [Candidatus Omnitrophica bacterium]|nr:30S ribosomal protein S2 [Candidatus Omnitrophota bacterium]